MYTETITIDVDSLREDMKNESLGAFFGGECGGALVEAVNIDRASDEELVKIAQHSGVDLRKYQI